MSAHLSNEPSRGAMLQEDPLEEELIARFGNNRWIDKRHDCSDIISFLSNHHNDSQHWLAFFKALYDRCDGRYLSTDKQWGTLMSLMGISRKLNHRSVRIKDIIAQRPTIQARWTDILSLNESSRRLSFVESLLADLELNLNRKCYLSVSVEPSEFIVNLQQARGFMLHHCQRLARSLELELHSKTVISDSRYEIWAEQLKRLESITTRLLQFLSRMHRLQTQLEALRPLVDASQPSDCSIEGSSTLGGDIVSCKRQYKQVWHFNQRILLPSLSKAFERSHQSRDKSTTGLMLVKLLNPLGEFNDQTFDRQLNGAILKLEDCQTQLNSIMQTLRLEFGRFYFISDLELLSLVSIDFKLVRESSTNQEYSNLLSKLFNNSICSCQVSEGTLTGVRNHVGETITLHGDPIPLERQTVVYSLNLVRILNELARKLNKTLESLFLLARQTYKYKLEQTLPIQLVCLLHQTDFCQRVEACLDGGAQCIRPLIDIYESRFKELVTLQLDDHVMQVKKSALLSLVVHFLSTLKNLDAKKVCYRSDWTWQKQLRYYEQGNSKLEVRIGYAKYTYKFNLLPVETSIKQEGRVVFKRLTYTELNQRCYLVAGEAVCNLKLGAQPFGPAGSGKTETIKALGYMLGCQVVVHNCDQTNDIEPLQRLLIGLAHVGIWGCLDEFNRLNESVLSAISYTLELVQSALNEGRTSVDFGDGEQRCINQDCAYFITLNPCDESKYRGRRRIPANLRSLFIPISMSRVQIDRIVCENLLTTIGDLGCIRDRHSGMSETCFRLSAKISQWLDRARDILDISCQWDLRFAVAILKRLRILASSLTLDSDQLELLVVEAIKSEVEPRLGGQKQLSDRLDTSLGECFDTAKLGSVSGSSYSLYQTLKRLTETHIGSIFLKPASLSTTYLCNQLNDNQIRWLSINPRASRIERFLGLYDSKTMHFRDGTFTSIVRRAIDLLSKLDLLQVWIILDGPIDPDWIESLNSVLDDNQTLTLVSGERIQFTLSSGKSIKLIFVTESLRFCSPATLSRLSLVEANPSWCAATRYSGSNSEILDKFMLDRNHNLLAIIGRSSVSSKLSLISSRTESICYTCSEFTTAEHLLSLLDLIEDDDLVIILGLDQVKYDFQVWGVKSSLELLDYVTTFSSYQRPSDNSYRSIHCKIVLIAKSEKDLGSRLSLKAMTIKSDVDFGEVEEANESETISELIRETSGAIQILISNDIEQTKISTIEMFKDHELMLFCRHDLATLTMKRLEQAIDNIDHSEAFIESKVLYLIDWIEITLLEDRLKADLWHYIEMVKLQKLESVKIVLLLNETSRSRLPHLEHIGCISNLRHSSTPDWNETVRDKLGSLLSVDHIDKLIKQMQEVEIAIFGTNFESFVSFIELSCHVICQNQVYIRDELNALSKGLYCLQVFDTNIEKTKLKLKNAEIELRKRTKEIESVIVEVDRSIVDASKKKMMMDNLKSEQNKRAAEIRIKRNLIKESLEEVSLKVHDSQQRIKQNLKPEALNEIRTLRDPPKTVKDILDVLFIFLSVKDTSWSSIRTNLAKISLRDELSNYDFRENLSENLLSEVELQLKVNVESFQEQQASRASVAVLPILGWIKAAVEYGRVLLKLKPLESELKELSVSLEQLQKAADQLGVEQEQVEGCIEANKRKLESLRTDLERFNQSIVENSRKLSRANEARLNCSAQVKRWQHRLNELSDQTVDTDALKACLAACCLPFSSLQATLELSHRIGFPVDADLRLILKKLAGTCLLKFEPESDDELSRQVSQLLAIKLCLMTRGRLPFLEIQEEFSTEQILETVDHKSILADRADSLCAFDLDLGHDPIGRVELAARLDKTIVVVMSERTPPGRILELYRLAESTKRIILAGRLKADYREALRENIKFLKFECKNNLELEGISSSISNYLTETFDADLKDSINLASRELRARKEELSKLEMRLLQQLAQIKVQPLDGTDPDGTTIDVLSELHKLNETLTGEIERKELDLSKFRSKQSRFSGLARQASEFYLDKLAGLGKLDRFYHISLARFQAMLAKQLSADRASAPSTILAESLKRVVMREVAWSMRAEHAKQFIGFQQVGGSQNDSAELEQILASQLSEIRHEHSCAGAVRLMIVLHEPTSSSPQPQLDEFFRTRQTIAYFKVYASKELSCDRLKALLSGNSDKSNAYEGLRCVCVANAHLASKLFNTHLLSLMEQQQPNQVLLVLVGEAATVADLALSAQVYERAQARIWFDELSLDLCARFGLLGRSLLVPSNRLAKDERLRELAEQLLLLHVVCQELAKLGRWTTRSALFEYDQLKLALGWLGGKSVGREGEGELTLKQLRRDLAHYLEDVVYGCRLDTETDERLLTSLLARFVISEDLARVQMDRLGQLQQRSGTNSSTSQKLMDDLLR